MGMAAQGKAKAAKARSAVPAATATFLALFLAFLPGTGAARLAAQAASTGPAVPVIACASSYGAGPPAGLSVLPRSLRPGLPAGVAKMLAYYTNDRRTLDPVLAPRGWDCQVQVGADGTTGVNVYPPATSPTPSGTGHEEVQAASDSACQGCVYSTVCALVPAAGEQLGFAMLPCAPLKRGEVVTWISGSAKDKVPPIHDVIAFEEPGHDPTHGVVLYDYMTGQGGEASEDTCTLPSDQRALCTSILDNFVAHDWLMG
jgi:hypothetical protein